jgi:AraC family transcriptional regulator
VSADWRKLESLLVAIHAQLDETLTLDTLAAHVELSPYRLHRLFKALLGETPRDYIERVRLDRASFRLLVQDADLLHIALDCGFTNPDTFARAFRRRFGRTPSAWRAWALKQQHAATTPVAAQEISTTALSATRLVRLRPMHLASIRHLGPYEDVPESLFDELDSWSMRCHTPGPRVWMGIGHDIPSVTPVNQLRFDACLVVPAAFKSQQNIVHRLFAGGDFALTTYVGPYATIGSAYTTIMSRLLRDSRMTPAGLPAVEIYHTARVDVHAHINTTDICLPVMLHTEKGSENISV